MEPFPGHKAASKGVHIISTTKVKIYCSCRLPWPDASPVENGFTKPVKTSVILCLKEKLILYVVNAFEYFMLNSSLHKLQYHLNVEVALKSTCKQTSTAGFPSAIKGNFPGKESCDSITMAADSKTARFKSTCITLINFTVAVQS